MNDHECAHRRDLVLCAARWVAATDDSGWVWDPRTERVYLSPRLQNLLGRPAPVATLDELMEAGLPVRAALQTGGGLVWSDPIGVMRSRSECFRARHCCPACTALPIEIGLLEGVAGAAAPVGCDLVEVAVGAPTPSAGEVVHDGRGTSLCLREPSGSAFTVPDPFRERMLRLAELYADVPEDYRLLASRAHHRSSGLNDVVRAVHVFLLMIVVPLGAAVAVLEGAMGLLVLGVCGSAALWLVRRIRE